jgi:hypothetical protein
VIVESGILVRRILYAELTTPKTKDQHDGGQRDEPLLKKSSTRVQKKVKIIYQNKFSENN